MSSSRRKLRVMFAVESYEFERVTPSFSALTGGTTYLDLLQCTS